MASHPWVHIITFMKGAPCSADLHVVHRCELLVTPSCLVQDCHCAQTLNDIQGSRTQWAGFSLGLYCLPWAQDSQRGLWHCKTAAKAAPKYVSLAREARMPLSSKEAARGGLWSLHSRKPQRQSYSEYNHRLPATGSKFSPGWQSEMAPIQWYL